MSNQTMSSTFQSFLSFPFFPFLPFKMNLIQITPENVSQYIGHEILFKTRRNHMVKRIIGISNSCKTIQIDHPDLENRLQIVSRKVYAIIN